MDSEITNELIESSRLVAETITEQLNPAFSIVLAMLRAVPPEIQKKILAALQADVEAIDLSLRDISPQMKALQIVSLFVSGGDGDAASEQRLRLILGGKKDT